MKLQEKNADEDFEMDMSPMIDMVFLLLIFFIVASKIVDEKPQVEIPEAAYGKHSEDQTGRIMISVQVNPDNPDEALFYVPLNNDPVDLDVVKERIRDALYENEELKVLVRADANINYEVSEQLSQVCAEVGAQRMIYSVFEE